MKSIMVLFAVAGDVAASGEALSSFAVLKRGDPEVCLEVVAPGLTVASRSPPNGCDIYSIAGCAAAVGAAAIACGPLGPADIGCILAVLAAVPGCGPCLCSSISCPSWCPCGAAGASDFLTPLPTVSPNATCASKGFSRMLNGSSALSRAGPWGIELKVSTWAPQNCLPGSSCPCFGNCCCVGSTHICGNDLCYWPAKQCSGCNCVCSTSGTCPTSGSCVA